MLTGGGPGVDQASFMIDEVRRVGGDRRKQRVTGRCSVGAKQNANRPIGSVSVAHRRWMRCFAQMVGAVGWGHGQQDKGGEEQSGGP